MAKKKAIVTKSGFLRAASYIGLVASGLVFLVGGILNLIGLSQLASFLSTAASVLMLIGIAWPAWDYCKTKAQWVKILYYIALVLYILGLIFGFLKL